MIENEEIIKLLIEKLEQQKMINSQQNMINSELISFNKTQTERIVRIEERLKTLGR